MLTVDLDRAGVTPAVRVLDLGCGDGRHAFACARVGAAVVALDHDEHALGGVASMFGALDAAGDLPDVKSTGVLGADALVLPFADATFDVVICSEVLEHIGDDLGALRECARVLRSGGCLALSVPRAGPERLNWLLSDEYHGVDGGHIRIYRGSVLLGRARRVGFGVLGVHHAHALHAPYWWLRCALGVGRDDQWAVRAFHRLLVWEIERAPRALRFVERALAPMFGKSLVVYLVRAPR